MAKDEEVDCRGGGLIEVECKIKPSWQLLASSFSVLACDWMVGSGFRELAMTE